MGIFPVVHLPNLRYHSKIFLDDIIDFALDEAGKLKDLGFSGIILENFDDQPFASTEVANIVANKFAIISHRVKKAVRFKLGINILRNACVQAMDIATLIKADFIRCNIWESAYVTDQGIIEGAAHDVISRKEILQSKVKVFADIFVKHATPLGHFSIREAAENALGRGGADQIIVSGSSTGKETSLAGIVELNKIEIYPLIGSGLTMDNLEKYKGKISGGIVGTSLKTGNVQSTYDVKKSQEFIEKWNLIFT